MDTASFSLSQFNGQRIYIMAVFHGYQPVLRLWINDDVLIDNRSPIGIIKINNDTLRLSCLKLSERFNRALIDLIFPLERVPSGQVC
jgi:hypothetical protein